LITPFLVKLFDKQRSFLTDYWSKKGCVLAILERTAEKYLNDWYRKQRRKPLVLGGARQVDKSALVAVLRKKTVLH